MKKTFAEIITDEGILHLEIQGSAEPNQKFYTLPDTLLGEPRRFNVDENSIEVYNETLGYWDHWEEVIAFQIIHKEV